MITSRAASGRTTPWIMLIVVAGCSSSPYSLVPVSGTVTLDGQPLAGGVINFQPVGEGTVTVGPGSTARIDAAGRFSLSTIRGQPGAVVAKHRVKIYSYSAETAKIEDGGSTAQRERVPARYNYQSDVTFDVPAGGTDKADFTIQSK